MSRPNPGFEVSKVIERAVQTPGEVSSASQSGYFRPAPSITRLFAPGVDVGGKYGSISGVVVKIFRYIKTLRVLRKQAKTNKTVAPPEAPPPAPPAEGRGVVRLSPVSPPGYILPSPRGTTLYTHLAEAARYV